jgi:L-arabinokinase
MRALQDNAPDLRVVIRTTAPEWLFAGLRGPVSWTFQAVDSGVIQPDSLTMDVAATSKACRNLFDRLPLLLEQESEFIRAQGVDLIVGDIPPACFELAARAALPSVAIGNFSWDAIYRAYAADHHGFGPLIDEMSRVYAKATLALTLPYPCGMTVFPLRQAIPWITRTSMLTRSQARSAFGLPDTATVVLLSFGGIGLDDLPWARLAEMKHFHFVTTSAAGFTRSNLHVLDSAQRRYEDLLRAADVVVSKPGYGIVADALAHQVPILYTERGEFPEYPFLVRALQELATAEFIPQEDLRAGNLQPYLSRLLDREPHWPTTPLNGATAAAEKILHLLLDGG